jgi:hypothetical protein
MSKTNRQPAAVGNWRRIELAVRPNVLERVKCRFGCPKDARERSYRPTLAQVRRDPAAAGCGGIPDKYFDVPRFAPIGERFLS